MAEEGTIQKLPGKRTPVRKSAAHAWDVRGTSGLKPSNIRSNFANYD
jgi:hypothetical protein